MRTAIVIDDEPITRMDLIEILQGAQFNIVAQGTDGFDAVDLCQQHKPELALMDIKMPVFDGLSAAEEIIQQELATCIVLITAFHDKSFIEKAKKIGVGGYLIKPIEERLIIPAIEIAISQNARYARAKKDADELKRRMKDKALVDQAKLIVSNRDGISEGEAYNRIRTLSMNKRSSMTEIAAMIVKKGSSRESIEEAKLMLMRTGIGECTAYKKIKARSHMDHCDMEQAAMALINEFGLRAR